MALIDTLLSFPCVFASSNWPPINKGILCDKIIEKMLDNCSFWVAYSSSDRLPLLVTPHGWRDMSWNWWAPADMHIPTCLPGLLCCTWNLLPACSGPEPSGHSAMRHISQISCTSESVLDYITSRYIEIFMFIELPQAIAVSWIIKKKKITDTFSNFELGSKKRKKKVKLACKFSVNCWMWHFRKHSKPRMKIHFILECLKRCIC